MISKLSIKRFKPFLDDQIEFKPLTFILGENGAGKSSLSQSLLVLKQALQDGQRETLKLNGSLVKIGNGVDAMSQNADENSIELAVELSGEGEFSIRAEYQRDSDSLPMILDGEIYADRFASAKFVYLSADRVGPQLLSSFSASDAASKQVSERGENALAILHVNQSVTLDRDDPRISSAMDSYSIKSAFDYYLSRISTGASIDLAGLSNVDSVASTFSFGKTGTLPTEKIRPTNVGFGLSYAASIIVACLLAEKGDILIIENPEAHLHTKGQRALADLFLKTSLSGAQIICETHSRDFLYYSRSQIEKKSIPSDLVNCNLVYRTGQGSGISEWFPLSRNFSDLGDEFSQFLEFFGKPTDYLQGSPL